MINRDYHKFRKQRDISFTRAYESKGTGWKTVTFIRNRRRNETNLLARLTLCARPNFLRFIEKRINKLVLRILLVKDKRSLGDSRSKSLSSSAKG